MSTPPAALDRRAALKARHREAILDAADALIRERGEARFSVDELADRADVARRTVFNHFPSLDDIVMTACTRVLTAAVDEFWEATSVSTLGDGSRPSLFAEFTAALRGMDLPSVIGYLGRVLGNDGSDPRSHNMIQDVFTRTADQISAEAAKRSTEMDEIETEIMVSSLINGIAVIARHWLVRTAGAVTPESRAVWDELVDRLLTNVRNGYAPPL